jgi:hypothetical protein
VAVTEKIWLGRDPAIKWRYGPDWEKA